MRHLYDYTVSVFSAMWSLENINTVLGVILLVLSIVNILYKGVLQIIELVKSKQYDKIDDVIDDMIDDIKDKKR